MQGQHLLYDDLSERCYYCGEIATSVDHVPPKATRYKWESLGIYRFHLYRTVPACHECNIGLGAHCPNRIDERKRWLKRWLANRYRKVLRMPEWTDSELAKLGPGMQRHVIAMAAKKERTLRRLTW
jgi:hypothetical protein